jgi:dTDP-glucose 4,6-dehydratase
MFETVLHGTERAIAAAGRDCRGFLLFSSGAVYGSHPALPHFSEDMMLGPDPSRARSAYAEAKRAAETVCAIAAERGLPTRLARCFAFVGPHMPFDRHFAIGNFVADALEGRPITIKSDGSPVHDGPGQGEPADPDPRPGRQAL